MYDIIIVGSGPAGISAALYTVRANLKTLIISAGQGALAKAEKIENYYGLSSPLSGKELHETGENQALSLGTEILREQVVSLEYDGNFIAKTSENAFTAKAVILATGASRKTPKISGIEHFEGSGVSYCAVCDSFFYKKKPVAVIGSGEYALHEALVLRNVTDSVTVLTNGENTAADFSSFNVKTEKIAEICGESTVNAITFTDGESLSVSGVFIALGIAGSVDIARKIGAEVNGSSIVCDDNGKTSVQGLFAAGDCTGGLLQISKAVSDGAKAAAEAIKYIKK